MNRNRASDYDQEAMFDLIESSLAARGVHRYEISNYSRPGFESRHNLIYWNDQPYWGIGVSAHSYFPTLGEGFGLRFWNSAFATAYEASVQNELQPSVPFYERLPERQKEVLKLHEAITDYCHTQLRKLSGMDLHSAEEKFGAPAAELIKSRAATSARAGLVEQVSSGRLRLTPKGRKLANLSFLEFTFSFEDLIS